MILSSKIDKYSYKEDLSKVDEFPYARSLFSDGYNSVIHVLLGFLSAHEPMIIPFFLGYQMYQYHEYDNTITDIGEFTIGFIAGSVIPVEKLFKSGSKEKVPNYLLYDLLDRY